ncbi:hypothetical protein KHQ81_02715 [Mycoplasmatota bacterium]|nr:hypothetical protein KHQ81_02715 [Mycoplasmatota bacterium]
MFSLNFKKDWRMNKSMLISFFAITLVFFAVNAIFYGLLKWGSFSGSTFNILLGIWGVLASLATLLGTILVIVLMYFVLKNDLGKTKIQYSIFTPQSLLSWYLPKVLFVFIVQGLFGLINLGYTYFIFDITNPTLPAADQTHFNVWDNITSLLTQTFNFGFFALMALCMALYYSFRKKGRAWTFIVIAVLIYFVGNISYPIYQQIQEQVNHVKFDNIPTMVIPYVIKNVIGLIYAFISLYLFDKKIEY